MNVVSRRRFLEFAAGCSVAAVAGCVDDVPGGESRDSRPAYSRWLPADLVGDLERASVLYFDVRRMLDDWPADATEDAQLDELEALYGVDEGAIEGMLYVNRGDGSASETDVLILGSIDVEAVVEDFTGGVVETETYEGYETVEDDATATAFAVGPDAVINSPEFRPLIDARAGDVDRIADVDDRWDAVLRNVGGAGFSFVQVEPGEEFEMLGGAWEVDGEAFTATSYAHFGDESAAEDGLDEIEAELDDQRDDGEITDVRIENDVVVVEAQVDEFDW